MTLTEWLIIGGIAIAAPILGGIAAAIVRKMLTREAMPEAIQSAATPISSLALSGFIVAGLIAILAMVKPEAMDQLVTDSINFVPKVLVAAIILIGANVASTFAVTAMAPALARMPLDIQSKIFLAVKAVIITMAALIAVGQIGVDTEVVNMAVGAVMFGAALAVALLISWGGRSVASEVATARSLKRQIELGDHLTVGEHAGTVKAFGPTHITLDGVKGEERIPASEIFVNSYSIRRTAKAADISVEP